MKNPRLSIFFLLAFASGCQRQPPNSLTIFAAASLVAPVQKMAAQFDSLHPGRTTRLNFAASSFLARQIEEHAPADVFISASPQWTTYLARRGFVDSTAIVVIAQNLLVIIADRQLLQLPLQLRDLLQEKFWPIATGDPSHVPLGQYAKESLTRAGLWETISPHLLPALDADAAVATVERGEAPVGIAYQNEAVDNPHVQLAFVLADSLQPEIQYTASVIKHSRNAKKAQAFVQFLSSPQGQFTLQSFHFLPPAHE